ncbi:MAG: tetratricopeptide repeat protein [Woeseiaceae bacterium]
MQNISQAIQAGYAAFQRGAFAEARRHLQPVGHPKAIHLLGLVEKSDGNLPKAVELLQRAATLDSQDPEIANNLALVAQSSGRFDLAESEFRRAIKIRPDFHQAASGLGRLLIDLERWPEALSVYEQLLSAAPTNVGLRHGRATALLGLGQAERAETLFDELIQEGHDKPEVRFMLGRARLELGQIERAIADLNISYDALPGVLALKALASTYWMIGDTTSFNALLDKAVSVPGLAVTVAEMLRQSGAPERALAALEATRTRDALAAQFISVEATAYMDLKNTPKAEAVAREGLATYPDNRLIRRDLITCLLMQGKAAEAMPLIQAVREIEPNGQQWIAYEASALRLLGSERYETLVDLERFVRPYQLPTPDGFDSIDSFNSAFLSVLDRWHQYKTHPLDQSLRDGSQTPRDLMSIDDPVLRAFQLALDEPIRRYMAEVGNGNDHPLTSRNTGSYRIAGAWSVRLHGGGRHVNHVHPEGWISSSYYVSVPKDTKSDSDKAGWIKFAEPPFETTPPSPPEKWICPEAGMLVLFPSFLWHGTQPIHDGSVRVTAPFDAVPA